MPEHSLSSDRTKRSSGCILQERPLIGAIALLFIILIVLLARLPQIYGDAPGGDVSRSGDFLADEGTWGISAMRWILTGQWRVPDAYNPGAATPVFMASQYLLLQTFGIHLSVLRYSSVFCSLIAILGFFFLMRKHDHNSALLAALFAAINFPLIIFNRLAFIENLLLCFMIAGAVMMGKSGKGRLTIWTLVAVWLLFALGYFTKPSILFFLPVFISIILYSATEHKKKIFLQSVIIILIIAAIAWFVWISRYLDDWRYFQQLNVVNRFSLNPFDIVRNYAAFFGHLKLFEFMPVEYLLGLVMVLNSLKLITNRQHMSYAQMLFSFWLIWGMLYLGFFAYSPPRYSILLIVPILGLAAIYCQSLMHANQPIRFSPIILLLATVLLVCQCVFALYRITVYHQFYPSCFLPWLGWPVMIILWRVQKGVMRRQLAAYIIIISIIVVQAIQISRYHIRMEFSLYHAIQHVADIINQEKCRDTVIVGDSAMLMSYAARVPAIDIIYRQETLPKVVQELKPRYLFLEAPQELTRLRRQVPGYFDNVQELGHYPLMRNYAHGVDGVFYLIQ